MRQINKHIIHCSDSTFGNVMEIRRWHLARGFDDVGYHFVIIRNGEIEVGRQLCTVGAHCRGYNIDSIGTCLIGVDNFNQVQLDTLTKLHNGLLELFPNIKAYGHREFNKHKTCPNLSQKIIDKPDL